MMITKYDDRDIEITTITNKDLLKFKLLGYCRDNKLTVYCNSTSVIVFNESEVFQFRVLTGDDGNKYLRIDTLRDAVPVMLSKQTQFITSLSFKSYPSIRLPYIVSYPLDYLELGIRKFDELSYECDTTFKGESFRQYSATLPFGVRVFADERDKHVTESDLHDDFIVLEKSESFQYRGIVLNMTTIGNAKFDCTSVYNYDNNVECATSLVNQFNDFKRQTGIGKGLFVLRSLRGDSLIVVNEEDFVNIRILESRVNFVNNLVFRVESSCRDLLIKENKGYARFNRLYIQSKSSEHKIKISFEDYLNFDEGKKVTYKGVNYMLWDVEDIRWRCTTECGSQLPISIFYEGKEYTVGLNIINKKFQLLDMTGIDNLIAYRNEYMISRFNRKGYV